ncbi:SMP-30/gluconolactonase/LRE family protein [Hylemonella gracilis]|uniref:SMP-30/gluconolaconase/LRE domain protein n=1 Tax=Hylemonella gracilis ATCC 19624 TaxID=887062 RepID=F3KUG9_9BURK|nr:SMP-30/gluconolactonase/LRE family protein [Hylemonella gracilis]EGI76546.1 SMP-30/gluconolaconase/LRE domain protein [Hylemonella gracilis ATCC 19624]
MPAGTAADVIALNPPRPQCLWPVAATLGEGVVWHAQEAAVYFVDIKQRQLHRFDTVTGARRDWEAPGQIGFALPHADGGLVCGVQGGLHRFDPRSGTFSLCVPVETDRPGNRLNDGHVDAEGALWFGSMDDAETEASGVLYRIGRDGVLSVRDTAYVITNGPAFSPDGATLYHNDTLRRVVHAFDVGTEGVLSRKRVFTRIAGSGYPDGMAVDREGCLWVALFGGGRIERFSPDGGLLGAVHFPCSNITKLAFGGDDLRTVYVSTARKGLDEAALAQQPLAGGLFMFQTDVPGLAPTPCTVPLDF